MGQTIAPRVCPVTFHTKRRGPIRGKPKPYDARKRLAYIKKQRDTLAGVVGLLMKAMEHYADERMYNAVGGHPLDSDPPILASDRGARARNALKDCVERKVPNYPRELAAAQATIRAQREEIKVITQR